MELLDDDKSWELFCAKTFGEEEDCPLELVEIGKRIVAQCKGLPLSIVVIGGHLRKCSRTEEQWLKVARDMISFLDSGEEQCLSILSLSYSHLPAYLKPCFLYMGIFKVDEEILVSDLIRVWIAEGFLRLDGDSSLEEVAEGCLKEFVDRNLISAKEKGRNGKLSTYNIHDLLRELCLKVAKKEKFSCVLKHPAAASRCSSGCPICNVGRFSICEDKLLRIMRKTNEEIYVEFRSKSHSAIFKYFNLRNIYVRFRYEDVHRGLELSCYMYLHWNLQTLVIHGFYGNFFAPVEIWKMPQLRHVIITDVIRFPDPPQASEDDSIMSNLRKLSVVMNFKLVEEVSRRIPNIEVLELRYGYEASSRLSSEYHQYNLARFRKLESFRLEYNTKSNWRSFTLSFKFPDSLQEMRLDNSCLQWEDLSMIGSLLNLEVLTLIGENSVMGSEWNSVEGEFCRLKPLRIDNCNGLVCWNGERSHFPVMESLSLGNAYKLAEFPCEIGEIPTLELIDIQECSADVAISAVKMLVEQEELGNNDLRLIIMLKGEEELKSVTKMVDEEDTMLTWISRWTWTICSNHEFNFLCSTINGSY